MNGPVTYHGGLKEFIDHAISVLGRTHLKPTTECLRGVVTYPTGDATQGRFEMTLMDLQNKHYTVAVREVHAATDVGPIGQGRPGGRCGRDAIEYLLWSEGFYA